MKKVGIIILNWNCASDTISCIKSLKSVQSCSVKVLVIDNGSSTNDVRRLKQIDSITLICNKQNLGYAKGINQGINYFINDSPRPDYILQLNNDTYCKDDFIKPLINVLETNNKIGSVGSLVYSAFSKKNLGTGGVIDVNRGIISYDYKNNFDIDNKSDAYLVDWVAGTSNLIKVEVIKEVGLLEEKYDSYVEDVEYSLRIHQIGYKTAICPSSVIYHKVSRSSGGQYSMLKRYLISRNTMYLSKRYFTYKFTLHNSLYQLKNCFNYPRHKVVQAFIHTIRGIVVGILT